jgi:uncharacterized protein YdeI (YjbR/CyaY-like superfamily)
MNPVFFTTPSSFRKWLKKNHRKEKELLVGFYKVGSGKPSITWPESVDQALCFGWIDGVRRTIDTESYSIRFTPRKPSSIWSAINIKKAEELISLGLMEEAGLEAFKKRTEERSRVYSFESEAKQLTEEYEKRFKANKKAWKFYISTAPYYKRVIAHWILSAKQEKTRDARLEKAIMASEEGKKLF